MVRTFCVVIMFIAFFVVFPLVMVISKVWFQSVDKMFTIAFKMHGWNAQNRLAVNKREYEGAKSEFTGWANLPFSVETIKKRSTFNAEATHLSHDWISNIPIAKLSQKYSSSANRIDLFNLSLDRKLLSNCYYCILSNAIFGLRTVSIELIAF